MTRGADVAFAGTLGAGYVGVIFAGGPRHQSLESARRILEEAPPGVRRVGVMGDQPIEDIAGMVRELSLDVVQLHADPPTTRIRDVRDAVRVETWAVLRIAGSRLPASFEDMSREADAIVLDARSPGGLGGSGITLPWSELACELRPWRDRVRIVLAGGLRSQNVAEAIEALEPDVVDVSSGVESAPGIKDHERMRAFRDAVQRARIEER